MTTDNGESSGDQVWRRPSDGAAGPQPPAGTPPRPEPAPRPDPARPASGGSPNPWQRPADLPPAGAVRPGTVPATPPPYAGPPPTDPPPAGWRPPLVVQPSAPRSLPAQDSAQIDADERNAHTLTLGVGMIAGAITLIVTCLLCSRLLF